MIDPAAILAWPAERVVRAFRFYTWRDEEAAKKNTGVAARARAARRR